MENEQNYLADNEDKGTISVFIDWIEWSNFDEVYQNFSTWKDDHLEEWNRYKSGLTQIEKDDIVYELRAWNEYFYYTDSFELWESQHREEWSVWKIRYDLKWQIEKNQYHFNNQSKEFFLVWEWKKANPILWNDWKEKLINEVEVWKRTDALELQEVTTSYIESLKKRLVRQLRFKRNPPLERPERLGFKWQVNGNEWSVWRAYYIEYFEENYLEEFKNNIKHKLKNEWAKCFKGYEKGNDLLGRDFWMKTHLNDDEKKEFLAEEFTISNEMWINYLNSLDSYWMKKEEELKSRISEAMGVIYEMKIFYLWKDDHPHEWSQWYERYIWESKWQPENQPRFQKWLSKEKDENFFELLKEPNSFGWNEWKSTHWSQWKSKVDDLEIWKKWVMEHIYHWNRWAETRLDNWRNRGENV